MVQQSKEHIVVDPVSGAKKGQKLEFFHLIPPDFLWYLARHYGVGTSIGKYEPRNWEKGLQWSLVYNSMQRHISLFMTGERYDEETGSHHLICAAWHIIALWWFDIHNKGTNDLISKFKRQRKVKKCTIEATSK